MHRQRRIVVAMSGGVDSSVAAALLSAQGYEVIGMTMCFGSASGGNLPDTERKKPSCCGIQGIEDARRVCHKLGIRHYVVNMRKDLYENVVKDFISEYRKGRTPNPCVRCNQYLKFNVLLKRARALGAQYLATGHYARIGQEPGILLSRQAGRNQGPKFILKKAKDKKKDQSYFLYRLTQGQLKHILFPLGGYTKEEVRKVARKFGLAVADKASSQEICFLPDNDYRGFLREYSKTKIDPGPILDTQGNILGEHKGIAFYTIGQREGLGIAMGYPVYVVNIDAKNNAITAGRKEDALRREFTVKEANFIVKHPKKKIASEVRIRYNHKQAKAEAKLFGNGFKVKFYKPQFAITPGQAAVFYAGDRVLGGGIIDEVLG